MPDISIIIVNYNVKEFILNLLNSISKATGNLKLETIVVDNASNDGSVEALKEKFPKVKLIENNKNLGFGAANNQALKLASGNYFLLINPDTIVKENTLSKMIEFFETYADAGLAGCKVLNPDGTLQLACRRSFPGPWTSFTKVMGLSKLFPKSKLFAQYNLTYLDENKTYEVDAVSGSFMMLRKEVYEKIGGFDPDFFMYGEDLDLCYRVQKSGSKVFYFNETEIIHYKGESTKRSSIDETKMFYDAMHLFVKKHFSASFIGASILQSAIFIRKAAAFINLFRIVIAAVLIDAVFLAASIYSAEHIYSSERWPGFPEIVKPWVYIFFVLVQVIISGVAGAYGKKKLSILKVIISLIIGLVFLSSLTFFFKQYGFSRAVILITYAMLLFLLPVWRTIFKVAFRFGREVESKKTRTIVVGTGTKAKELAAKLKTNISSIHNVIGYVGFSWRDLDKKEDSLKIIGTLENIKKIIIDNKIDKVIFTSDTLSFDEMFAIVSKCQGENVEFLVAGNELDYLVGKSNITMLDNIALLKVEYNISQVTHRVIKYLFDKIVSLLLLLLIYPFIYLIRKLTNKSSDFTEFILGIPRVVIGKYSLVGHFKSSASDDLYLGRPGLTGLWYTENADLNESSEMEKLNLFYAKNYNIWLDFEILGKTFSKMFLRNE
ncbi:MAG: glycosyltransferase [bacterium]